MQKPCGQRKLDSAEEIRARGCRVALERVLSSMRAEEAGARSLKACNPHAIHMFKRFFLCCLENSWVETHMNARKHTQEATVVAQVRNEAGLDQAVQGK